MAEGDPIRIIPHRGVDDDCGSVEVWFADGRKSAPRWCVGDTGQQIDAAIAAGDLV